ncbi:MAG: hypothetical protein AB2385_11265 [Symbiobacterium sp.]
MRYDYFGLNHMNFAYNLTVDGRPLSDEEFDRVAERVRTVDADLIRQLRLLPSPCLQYYFHTGARGGPPAPAGTPAGRRGPRSTPGCRGCQPRSRQS